MSGMADVIEWKIPFIFFLKPPINSIIITYENAKNNKDVNISLPPILRHIIHIIFDIECNIFANRYYYQSFSNSFPFRSPGKV